MQYIVEVRRIGADLATSMVEMRTWLHDNGLSSAQFDHSPGGRGITCRIGFCREDDALAYAKTFQRWLNNGTDPDGTALWQIIERPYERAGQRACDRAQTRQSTRDG